MASSKARLVDFQEARELMHTNWGEFPRIGAPESWSGRLEQAVRLAVEAGDLTYDRYFQRNNYQIERKRDHSPVTTADKEAEQHIRRALAESYPQDGILGEEFGTNEGTSGFQWVVDPIDGTKSFLCGVPLYSTLVAFTLGGRSQAGVIYIPGLKEVVFAGRGLGAWYASPFQAWRETRVSKTSTLKESVFVTSQVDNFDKRSSMNAYLELEGACYITRTWGDGYGYLLVATGRAELMIDPIVSPWDIAAIQPIIEEAGGRCTAWQGEFTIHSGDCIGSNGWVHDQALECLRSAGRKA